MKTLERTELGYLAALQLPACFKVSNLTGKQTGASEKLRVLLHLRCSCLLAVTLKLARQMRRLYFIYFKHRPLLWTPFVFRRRKYTPALLTEKKKKNNR